MSDEAVQGLSALVDNLNSLPLALGTQKNIIVRALRAGSQPCLELATANAPNDPDTDGSRIADNMGVVVSDQTATGAVARIGPKKWNYIGRFAEFGTKHQPAEPWLRPAFDATLDQAVQIIGDVVGTEIEKEMKKIA